MPVELWKQKEVYVYACFFNIYYHVKLYFDELIHPYVLRQINGIDVVFNVFSYVHIYSRHYIPNMNLDIGEMSMNQELEVVDLDELPDSVFALLEKANAQTPIIHTTEFCLFELQGIKYILWLKYKRLNETKDNGLEIRSFYRCTEERDLKKFSSNSFISING